MTCPSCSASIDLDEDELEESDPVTCEECGADLVVASVHPIELELANEDEEDEEKEEDEDFDEDEDEDDEEDFEEDEEEEDEWS